MNFPLFTINKNDAKYLTKLQIKKAEFLFENDYFIWNEAEMYLRYHDLFSKMKENSDLIYENLCKTTRKVFKIIHDVHYGSVGSNAAHLKFYELLDAWGAVSEYLKKYEKFPKCFLEWFESIFVIYQMRDENECDINGNKIVSTENLYRLYLIAGLDPKEAHNAINKITVNKKYQLTFERLVFLLKNIVISDNLEHFSHLLVPRLIQTLSVDQELKPLHEVLRNYDYEMNNLYSNLSEWKTLDTKKEPNFNNDNYNLSEISSNINKSINNAINANKTKLEEFKTDYYQYFNDTCHQQSDKSNQYKENYSNKTMQKSNYSTNAVLTDYSIPDFYSKHDNNYVSHNRSQQIQQSHLRQSNECFNDKPPIPIIDPLKDKSSSNLKHSTNTNINKIKATNPNTTNQYKTLASSVTELNKSPIFYGNSSTSSNASFKLCEFKREFKRSSFDLNTNGGAAIVKNLGIDLVNGLKVKKLSISDQKLNDSSNLNVPSKHQTANNSLLNSNLPQDLIFKSVSISDPTIGRSSTNATTTTTTTTTTTSTNENDEDLKFISPSLPVFSKNNNINIKSLIRSDTIRDNLLEELTNGIKNQSQKILDETERNHPKEQSQNEDKEEDSSSSSTSSSVSNSSSATSTSSSDMTTSGASNSSPNIISTDDQSSLTASSSGNLNSLSDYTKNASLIANVGLIEMSGVSGMVGIVGNKLQVLKTTKEQTNEIISSKIKNNNNTEAKIAILRASTPNCKSTNSTTNNSSWLNLVNNQSTIKTDPDSAPSLLRRHLMSSEFINNKNHLKNYPYQQNFKQLMSDNDVEQILNRNKHVKRSVCFKKRDGTKSDKTHVANKRVTINNNQIHGKFNRSFHIESEPIKLCVNEITLSSLDTLNDIDVENEDHLDQGSESTDENSATIDSSFIETQISSMDTEYFTNFKENTSSSRKSHKNRNADKIDSNLDPKSFLSLTLSDQKVINEITRKLKPFIQKCVKKEVRSYLDVHLCKHSMIFNKYDGKIMTKIGDF